MSQLPEAGAKITLDTSAWDAAYSRIVKQAAELDGIIKAVGGKITVDVSANTDMILADISKIDSQAPTVNVDIALEETAYRSLLDLNSTTLTPKVAPTLDDSAVKPLTGLDSETLTPKVSPTLEGGDAEALKKLTGIATLSLALEIVGPGVGVLQQAYSLLTANQEAMAILEARTGTLFEGADEALNNIYVATGAGRDEIAKTLAAAQGLGIDPTQIEGATQSAIAFAAIWDEDVSAAINAANQLVKTGLAPDFQSAFDVIQAGFEAGLNKGDDFLDTIKEYSSTFADLGLTSSEVLSVIKTGLDSGFDVSDRVADLFREFNIRAANPEETTAQDTLKALGMGDEAAAFQAGEITGAEFFKGVVGAIQGMNDESQAGAQKAAAANIFGSQVEDFSMYTVFGIEPVTTFFDEIDGRAAASATAFSDTFGSTVSTFFRDVQIEAETFLSSDQLGLKAKLDDLKAQFTETMNALTAGADLGEAIEIGFKVQGVQEAMDRLQSIAGNLAIGFLESVAAIQSFLGQGEGADTTRKEVARLGEGQLTFDLKLAENQEDITNTIQTAVARGVDMKTIAESAGTAISELLAGGNAGAAQALIEEIQFQGQGFTLSPEIDPIFGEGVMLQNSLNTWIENRDLDAINDAISKGLVVAPEGIDVSNLQTQVETAVATLTEQFDAALAAGDVNLANTIAQQLGDPALIEQVNILAEAMGGVTLAAENRDRVFVASALGASIAETAANNVTTAVEKQTSSLTTSASTMKATSQDLADALIGNWGSIEGAITRADEASHNAIVGNSIVPDLILLRNTALMNLPIISTYLTGLAASAALNLSITDSWVRVATNSMMGFGNVLPIMDLLIAKLGSVSVAATQVTSQVNGLPTSPPGGGGPQVTPMATGGAFASGQPLLFEGYGPEIVSFNRPGNVIGVEQTRQLMQGGTTINNYNNFNVVQNNNVQSQAQAVQAGYSIAKSIRGMGT